MPKGSQISGSDEQDQGAMSPEEFRAWMDAMGFTTREQAAAALGLSVDSIKHYRSGRRGNGRPAPIPLTVALACSALFHRLDPWGRPRK